MTALDGILLGIDVGGTKIAGLAVDAHTGELHAQARQPLDDQPLQHQVTAVARRLVEASGGERVAAIGLAVPGLVDAESGVMRLAVNVDAGELAIGPLVAEAMGVPCFVEHDARAAALWLLERGDPHDSLAYLTVGTGISTAVVVGGRLIRGSTGLVGEIGHTQVVEDGQACPCGLRGCLETVAAGPAVARLAEEALARGDATSLAAADVGPEAVYRAAAAGDQVALAIADQVGIHLARAIRGIALVYGIDHVVIGGGLSRAGQPFLRPILEEVEREQAASPLVSYALARDPVELLPADSDPSAWGAVAVARSGLHDRTPAAPEREVADE